MANFQPNVLFFVLVFLAIPYGVMSSTYQAKAIDTNCGLECWLANLTIYIPAQSTVEYGFNLTVEDIRCYGISIGGINSSYAYPTTLNVFMYNIQIECQAKWAFYQIDLPFIGDSGKVSATVNNSNILFGFSLNKGGSYGLAVSATTTKCETNIYVTDISISGIIQILVDVLKRFFIGILESELDKVICTELTNLVNTNLTQALLEVDDEIIPYLTPLPPNPAPAVPEGMLNLMTDPVVKFIGYMTDVLFGSNGDLSFNMLVDHFTNGTGSITLTNSQLNFVNFTYPVYINNQSFSNFTFGLVNITLTHLDTWEDVYFRPISNYTMNFQSGMRVLYINTTFYVNVTISGDDNTLYEEGNLVLKVSDNTLNSTFQLALIESKLDSLQATQYLDTGCLTSTIYNVNLTSLYFNMSADELDIYAVSGSAEKDLDQLIDNAIAIFTNSYRSAIPAFFNRYVATVIMKEANIFFGQEQEKNENATCEAAAKAETTFDEESTSFAFAGAIAVFLSFAIIVCLIQRRNRKLRMTLYESDEDAPLLEAPVDNDEERALVIHSKLSLFTRLVIPLLLLINMVLFISSNTSIGASVFILLKAGDKSLQTPNLFDFTLSNSVRDMWNAHVYPLSILIAVFSGSWPYLKLLIMLLCWLFPTNILAVKKREYLLMAVDMLGKWSLIDSFVLTLMMVSFQFHIASEYATADVYVEPHWGFYCFLFATMMSLVLSHVILAMHHHAVDQTTWDVSREKKEALWNMAFEADQESHWLWIVVKRYSVLLFLLLTAGLIGWGIYIFSFAFDFRGAAGWALTLVGESPKHSYSVLTLGMALPKAAPPNGVSYWGVRWIEVTYLMFTAVVPLSHLVVLIFLWTVPLKHTAQRRVFVVTEVLNAWSALEVFVVSIIAAILEIRQFAAFIVGDKCNMINPILKEYFNKELDGDTKCFDVIATLDTGCWVLFSACIIYYCVAFVVMKVCHRTLKEYPTKLNAGIN